MKVILGPTPCATCRQPVTVVRRDVEQPCERCSHRLRPDAIHYCNEMWEPESQHTHTIPDVGPFTTVDGDGTRHECAG